MNASTYRELRAKIPDADEELAADLGVTAEILQGWAAGTRRMTRLHEKRLRYFAAIAERETALATSGLRECPWMRRWSRAAATSDPDALLAHHRSAEAHAETCARCQAREQFVADRLGAMPSYPRGFVARALELPFSLPAWAQPVVIGALLLVGIVGVRVLIAEMSPGTFTLADAFRALAAAALGGAAGGGLYSLTRPTLRKLGTIGAYLTGVVCIVGYMGSVALIAPVAFGETLIGSRTDLIGFLVIATLFGLVFGHSAFRDARP